MRRMILATSRTCAPPMWSAAAQGRRTSLAVSWVGRKAAQLPSISELDGLGSGRAAVFRRLCEATCQEEMRHACEFTRAYSHGAGA